MTIHDKINRRKLRHMLKHILYPVRTADLRELMRSEGRGDALVDLMNRLPLRTWRNASEILDALSPLLRQQQEKTAARQNALL